MGSKQYVVEEIPSGYQVRNRVTGVTIRNNWKGWSGERSATIAARKLNERIERMRKQVEAQTDGAG